LTWSREKYCTFAGAVYKTITMKFEKYRISSEIKQNLENLGFRRPTDIQYKAIPAILRGEDVLAVAQTGTGKTAAFAIPVIHLLQERKRKENTSHIQCLVMEPTHELAIQIAGVFEHLSKNTGLETCCIYGGVEQETQIEKLQKGVDILISTPGRMFDLVSQGHISLRETSILILDEADHMLDLGFIKDITDVIKFLPRKHQTLFFSATINEKIKDIAYSLVKNPIRIQLSPNDPVSKNINHSVAFIEMDDKRFFLERIISDNPKSKILVFVRTKVRAERVLKALERVNIISMTIHSSKDQAERENVMAQFTTGDTKVLIATDVSARGIDIPDVDYVINYDLPDESENYVHRVGRTGRGMKRGIALSFCSPDEKERLNEIQQSLHQEIKVLSIHPEEYAETIFLSDDHNDDWQSLISDSEAYLQKKKGKKHK
jgi:ATP-dependent RNA helicase RhlE